MHRNVAAALGIGAIALVGSALAAAAERGAGPQPAPGGVAPGARSPPAPAPGHLDAAAAGPPRRVRPALRPGRR